MRARFGPTILPLALALVAVQGGASAAQERRFDEAVDLDEWIRGPVRYIARKEEAKAFKALGTDDERALFIERFWYLRDQDPDTMSNPYRHMFWERVRQANDNFTESSKPGWLTDRGKIHILYGPPTEIQEDLHLQTTESRAGGGHGLVRWIYDRPAGRMDMDAVVVVAFVRDGSGEYKLTNDPNLNSIFFDANAIRASQYDLGSRLRAESMGGGRSELSVMLDLGKMQEVPPEEIVLLERVETSEAYVMGGIDVRIDRFWHPQRNRPVVVITADLSGTSPESRPAVIARLAPVQPGQGEMRVLGEDSFRIVSSEDGVRLAQGRVVAEPGSYVLTLMVADPVKVETRLHQVAVTVAGDPGGLRLSDIVAADSLSPLEFRSLASYDEPYIVGPFNVVPKVRETYQAGDTVRVFFEVYGAVAPFKVAYQLEGEELDGTWVPLGQPSAAEQIGASQGWEVSTGPKWPLGNYRIRIEIEDAGGARTTTQLPFTLVAATEG